jgi:hypothetical protein
MSRPTGSNDLQSRLGRAMLPMGRSPRKFVPDAVSTMDGDLSQVLASLALYSCVLGRAVSLQFSILKVLAGQPDGRAAVADLNRYITLLSTREWTARMKRLSARAPDLDIFGSHYVFRDNAGWQLTASGYAFLAGIEVPIEVKPEQIASPEIIVTVSAPARQLPSPLRLVVDNPLGGRRTRGNEDLSDSSAVA